MTAPIAKKIGTWLPGDAAPQFGFPALEAAVHDVSRPVYVLETADGPGVASRGTAFIGPGAHQENAAWPLLAYAPPLPPERLGEEVFKKRHGIRYAYVAGAMANGITSARMVEAMGRAGMIGFFGAAGLLPPQIEAAVDRLQRNGPDFPCGFNLIHSPHDPQLEWETVRLYLRRGVRRVSAAAFLNLSAPLVYYRVKGIHRDSKGKVVCPNQVIAKLSRIEVAARFFAPPPEKILRQLVNQDLISATEAELARLVPMAEDITAEADSGGHTDNRPAVALLPTFLALRDDMQTAYPDDVSLQVGLAGGIATPAAAAAAFTMGAAYVLTGSINQACVESGTSEAVRRLLAEARQADVTMAPAADMFEMGINVQVLKRGTMFPMRAAKLYDFYRRYGSLDEIPPEGRKFLEQNCLRCTIEQAWQNTMAFFQERDPGQIEKARKDPRHKMALVFRSYLGQSSAWATSGDPDRRMDYQVWCGPSMGAFNQWVKGTFMERPENRRVATVARNLLLGAAVEIRAHLLRSQGISFPARTGRFYPQDDEAMASVFALSTAAHQP